MHADIILTYCWFPESDSAPKNHVHVQPFGGPHFMLSHSIELWHVRRGPTVLQKTLKHSNKQPNKQKNKQTKLKQARPER